MKRLLLALAGTALLSACQQMTDFVTSAGGGADSLRVAMRLASALPDSLFFKATHLRIRFATNTTENPLTVDTILPLSAGRWLSPSMPKTLGYTLQVTGLDSNGRAAWSGTSQGTAQGNDKVVGVLNTDVTLTASVPLAVGMPTPDTGAIDFPKTLTFAALPGAKRWWSLDGKTWKLFPDTGLRLDSAIILSLQARSLDTLTGAPFSPITRLSWSGKTVATPVWSIAGNRYFPGQSVKAALSCATAGATIQWSTDGTTWTSYTDSLLIDAAKTYRVRAVKAHQPTSAEAPQTWQWLSSDSEALATLAINTANLSPTFDPSVTNYVTDSVWAQSYVTVTATPKVVGVKVLCNGAACTSQQFAISDTGTSIQISTSINGTIGLTYSVRVPKSRKVLESDFGIPWNPNITYDTLVDTRDGQKYRTVKIGTQTWMAQNLNYKVDSSWWYRNDADSGAKYGRLYQWDAAMDGYASSTAVPSGVQGICPIGWHLPSPNEWDILEIFIDASRNIGGYLLKASSGWESEGNGIDEFGFRALPSGFFTYESGFVGFGNAAQFWLSSTYNDGDPNLAWVKSLSYAYRNINCCGGSKSVASSLRCIKDN